MTDREPHDAAILAWKHKDIWKVYGTNFCIEVSRHSEPLSDYQPELGENRWCIYAYIYPKHPYFLEFKGDSIYQDATCAMPLHAACSFLQWHRKFDGVITSVQVGADYNHLYDEHYSHMKTKEDAHSVFSDAIELYNWLEIRNAPRYEQEGSK